MHLIYDFRFALDLYKNKLMDVELKFSNPFRFTTSIGYNPRLKVLRFASLIPNILRNDKM